MPRALPCVCTILALLVVLATPGLAVTILGNLLLNGYVSGATFNCLDSMTVSCDVAAGGAPVYFNVIADLNGDGVPNAYEPCLQRLQVTDNDWLDESSTLCHVSVLMPAAGALVGKVVIVAAQAGQVNVNAAYTLQWTGAVSISGKVVDNYGASLPGILVGVTGPGLRAIAITGADGTYTLPAYANRVYEVALFQRPDAFTACLPSHRRVAVGEGPAADVSFRLLGDYTTSILTGRALAGSSSVPGVEMVLSRADGWYAHTTTDLLGRYRFRAPMGAYTLSARSCPPGVTAATAGAEVVVADYNVTADFPMVSGSQRLYGSVLLDGSPFSTAGFGWQSDSTGCRQACWSNGQGHYETWLPTAETFSPFAENGLLLFPAPAPVALDAPLYLDLAAPAPHSITAQAVIAGTSNAVPWAEFSAALPTAVGVQDRTLGGLDGLAQLFTITDQPYTVTVWSPDLAAENAISVGGPFAPPAREAKSPLTIPLVSSNNAATVEVAVWPTSGVPADTYFFTVTYTDADNDPPAEVLVSLNGIPYPLEEADAEDVDYTDGKEYRLSMSLPAVGTYTYAAGAWEGAAGGGRPHGWVESAVHTDLEALQWRIVSNGFNPVYPDVGQTVTVSAYYQSADGVAPASMKVLTRPSGEDSWSEVALSTTAAEFYLAEYTGTVTFSGAGTYDLAFVGVRGDTSRQDPIPAYSVEVQPVLAHLDLTPAPGVSGPYTFRLLYRDNNGTNPTGVELHAQPEGSTTQITAPMTSADSNPTDGAIYEGATSMSAGTWHYWYVANLPTGSVRLPAGTGTYSFTLTAGEPQITLAAPAEGATVKGVVHIEPAITDYDGVQTVRFRIDGTQVFYWEAPPDAPPAKRPAWYYDWNTVPAAVAEGAHTITIEVTDMAALSSTLTRHVTVDNTTFDDVPKTSGQWAYIEAVYREGITNGCSQTPKLYCPNSAVTRGQMAVFLCRAAGWTPLNSETPTFADVPKTSGQYAYIEAIYAHGVTAGCASTPTKLFCPDSAVTRGQMAVFLCRAAGIAPVNSATPTFADVPKTSGQYTYIEGIYARGITAGCVTTVPRQFCPGDAVTRGQMAVFLCRAFGISTTL